jgi:hypothetical protein
VGKREKIRESAKRGNTQVMPSGGGGGGVISTYTTTTRYPSPVSNSKISFIIRRRLRLFCSCQKNSFGVQRLFRVSLSLYWSLPSLLLPACRVWRVPYVCTCVRGMSVYIYVLLSVWKVCTNPRPPGCRVVDAFFCNN